MLAMFEKLINEHGSSVILKERIELINDKYEALETKLVNSEKEKELLQQENELLKQKIEQLQAQVIESQPKGDDLPTEQQSILKSLFKANSSVRDEIIAQELNIEIGVLNYHLDELQEKGFLNHPSIIMGNSITGAKGFKKRSISKSGRKYVVECLGT
jgi:septal ring factor EnvC (AmiA/AmiB activator)